MSPILLRFLAVLRFDLGRPACRRHYYCSSLAKRSKWGTSCLHSKAATGCKITRASDRSYDTTTPLLLGVPLFFSFHHTKQQMFMHTLTKTFCLKEISKFTSTPRPKSSRWLLYNHSSIILQWSMHWLRSIESISKSKRSLLSYMTKRTHGVGSQRIQRIM